MIAEDHSANLPRRWRKKLLAQEWCKVWQDDYRGWTLVESDGKKRPLFVKLAIRNKIDKSSKEICREFDDVAEGKFYSRDWSSNGSVYVNEGEVYDSGWWFQKLEDAYEFVRRYGGAANQRRTTHKTPAVTTRAPQGELYPDFQRRVAEDIRRVKAKCDALDRFTPRCTSCGETCDPIDAGARCEVNGSSMISRWAEEKAGEEFYRLGNFAHNAWHSQEVALAALLDRVRAGEI